MHPPGSHYITQLRHPVERVVSEWMHCRNKMHGCWGQFSGMFKEKELWPYGEFITHPRFQGNDRHVKLLVQENFYTLNNSKNTELLQAAKENLLKLTFFSLKDQDELSYKLLAHTFLTQPTKTIFPKHINPRVEGHVDNVTNDEVLKTRELNEMDMNFYCFAVALFNQRVTQMDNWLASRG